MDNIIPGIHHITAICDDPQQNIDFYVGILGLRFVKQTVNFDMPDTYHLYYGDEQGHPGTILTFFSWPDSPKGYIGTGQIGTVAFSIPETSLNYWEERLSRHNILVGGPNTRFDEKVLSFMSPDGLVHELVAHPEAPQYGGWKDGPIPLEHAIRGFHSVALMEENHGPTAELLTGVLGFQLIGQEGNRSRYKVQPFDPADAQRRHDSVVAGSQYKVGIQDFATRVDVLNLPEMTRGRISVGSVHHIAWRTPNDEQQLAWRDTLTDLGMRVTPVMDRQYFHSIYFNEPGGVLFEIATDPPGFAVDEPPDQLGTHLKLPPWLESRRPILEQSLPPLRLPF